MAKKSAGNSKNSRHSRNKSTAGSGSGEKKAPESSSTTNATTNNGPTTPRPPPAPTPTQSKGIPFIYRFLLLLYPILQMLWTLEAPIRPFSAVRDLETLQLKRGKDELIEPRILVVLPHVRDIGFFAPTVGILEGTDRREKCWVGVLGLSSEREAGGVEKKYGEEEREEDWKSALDVFRPGLGVGLLDIPELRDEPGSVWDADVVADAVLPYILKYNVDTILTFDEKGITGNQHHTAVSQGLSKLIHSQQLKDALLSSSSSTPSLHPRIYHLHTPSSPLLNPGLGPLSPLAQHIILVYRALRGSPSPSSSNNNNQEAEILATLQKTTFVSDLRTYVRSWKALLALGGEMRLGRIIGWMVGRSLWVNEWVEVL